MRIDYLADHPRLVPELAELHWQQWGALRPGDNPRAIAYLLRASSGKGAIPSTVIALDGGQLLGSAMLLAHDMGGRAQLSPWLAGVFVRPEARRRGLGSALVRRVENEATALGVPRLYLYTDAAETLYQRLGWTVRERTRYRGGAVTIMVRELLAGEPAVVAGGAGALAP